MGHRPVYEELRDELIELAGAEVYGMVVKYLEERRGASVRLLPHPAVRGEG